MANYSVPSLQVFRGIAALAVVVIHAKTSTQTVVGGMPATLAEFLHRGCLSVDFFRALHFHHHVRVFGRRTNRVGMEAIYLQKADQHHTASLWTVLMFQAWLDEVR